MVDCMRVRYIQGILMTPRKTSLFTRICFDSTLNWSVSPRTVAVGGHRVQRPLRLFLPFRCIVVCQTDIHAWSSCVRVAL